MTPVLVPLRLDGSWRGQSWRFVHDWWLEQAFGPIHTGDVPGKFNRAAARNAAAAAAGDWDVAIFSDADTFMPGPEPIWRAIDKAAESGQVVLPHDRYVALTSRGTLQALRGHRWDQHVKVVKAGVPLGIMVVPRVAWEQLGGFDSRFQGWGGEDVAFRIAASTLCGLERLPGTIVHLWHPIDATKRHYIASRGGPLRQAYREANGDRAAMQALVEENG